MDMPRCERQYEVRSSVRQDKCPKDGISKVSCEFEARDPMGKAKNVSNGTPGISREKALFLNSTQVFAETIRIIAGALAMNPALRFVTSQRFLGLFSTFGLLSSLAVFAQHVLR